MSAAAKPSYILRHLKNTGLGETAILMLNASKSSWTEENPKWPQEKPNQPFGRLPVLIEKSSDGSPDFALTESGAIDRYLARSLGFFPPDPKKTAHQEQLHDRIADIIPLIVQEIQGVNTNSKEKINELIAKLKEVLPESLTTNGSSITPGSSGLTYIDFFIYAFFRHFVTFCELKAPEYAAQFKTMLTPEVTKVISNVYAYPNLQSHVADDRKVFSFLA
ncbi:transferase activity protein [Coemansia sp. Benny D160-2]|nr:transferase activity protein [Coemansia sp. Benny D160-2]